MKETLVVNIYGGETVKRTTLINKLHTILNEQGYNCKVSTAFYRDLIGKSDIVLVHRPILLTSAYNIDDKDTYDLCLEVYNQCKNLDFILSRDILYDCKGNIKVAEELEIDNIVEKILDDNKINHYKICNYEESNMINLIKYNLGE